MGLSGLLQALLSSCVHALLGRPLGQTLFYPCALFLTLWALVCWLSRCSWSLPHLFRPWNLCLALIPACKALLPFLCVTGSPSLRSQPHDLYSKAYPGTRYRRCRALLNHSPCLSIYLLIFIQVELIYTVVLISAVQQMTQLYIYLHSLVYSFALGFIPGY